MLPNYAKLARHRRPYGRHADRPCTCSCASPWRQWLGIGASGGAEQLKRLARWQQSIAGEEGARSRLGGRPGGGAKPKSAGPRRLWRHVGGHERTTLERLKAAHRQWQKSGIAGACGPASAYKGNKAMRRNGFWSEACGTETARGAHCGAVQRPRFERQRYDRARRALDRAQGLRSWYVSSSEHPTSFERLVRRRGSGQKRFHRHPRVRRMGDVRPGPRGHRHLSRRGVCG
mmetsp:Transcript_33490/g.92537  ORF Transcript_33490/g.92537 Transcript_33490/m.92537 type:complete len:231 (-) Transcript_33490:197-889(-)